MPVDPQLELTDNHRLSTGGTSGQPSTVAIAAQKRLDEYKKPHGNAWWLWTVLKNRAYSVWIEVVKPIFLRR